MTKNPDDKWFFRRTDVQNLVESHNNDNNNKQYIGHETLIKVSDAQKEWFKLIKTIKMR